MQNVTFGQDISEFIDGQIAKVSAVFLDPIEIHFTLGFGGAVQYDNPTTQICGCSVGQNFVLKLGLESDAMHVQEDMCYFVGKNGSNAVWLKSVVRVDFDEKITGVGQFDTARN